MKSIQGNKTEVKIISRKGASILVEYIVKELPIRKFVPAEKEINGFVDNDVLEHGIPYGYPWSNVKLTFNGERFEKEMRNAGLWTVQDVMKFPQKLWSALNATFAEDVSSIIEIAKSENKRSM
jgi:hypothetical protein